MNELRSALALSAENPCGENVHRLFLRAPGRDGAAKPIHVWEFIAFLDWEGIEVKPIGVWAPNQNAVAERVVQSAKRECLDHALVFGETPLRHILSEY